MSSRLMGEVLTRSRSRGAARLVLLVVADSVDDERGYGWRSVASLAERSGMSERATQRALSELRALGEVVVTRRGPHETSQYRVVLGVSEVSPLDDPEVPKVAPLSDLEVTESVTRGATSGNQGCRIWSPEVPEAAPYLLGDLLGDRLEDRLGDSSLEMDFVEPERDPIPVPSPFTLTAADRGIARTMGFSDAQVADATESFERKWLRLEGEKPADEWPKTWRAHMHSLANTYFLNGAKESTRE